MNEGRKEERKTGKKEGIKKGRKYERTDKRREGREGRMNSLNCTRIAGREGANLNWPNTVSAGIYASSSSFKEFSTVGISWLSTQ